MTFTQRQFRALEAATTSADQFRWSDLGLPGDDVLALIGGGLLVIVVGTTFAPLASGTEYKLTPAGVEQLRERMRLITERCTHPTVYGGMCSWCGTYLPGGDGGHD